MTGLSVLVMNSCSLTVLREHCLIGRVTRRVSISHSIKAGIGVEPVLSCGNDVGGDVPDELDEQKVVDKP